MLLGGKLRSLTSIVAVNRDGVIGRRNGLPWRLRTDMKFFREQTLDNVVIMGRKTFDSLGRGALPRRYNIIISGHFALFPEDSDCRTATEWIRPGGSVSLLVESRP
jgi:dihydrofolate reductase